MDHLTYLLSLEAIGIKLGLDQIRALVAGLGHPDRSFQAIIVAGTNGKGSVTAMVERGLRAAGHRTGRYTSPHLSRLNERFTVDGKTISDEALESAAGRVRQAALSLPAPPSFFEATTAVALEWFRESGVRFAVLEVGLGGRLDATNVVTPIVAAITAIDFDHQDFLGQTLAAIAAEKAAVIKHGCIGILAPNPPEVEDVVARRCQAEGVSLVRVSTTEATRVRLLDDGHVRADVVTAVRRYGDLTLGLAGRHQLANALTALRALEAIDEAGVARVPADAVRAAVERVTWPGRLQRARWRGHDVLIDGAHNPAGARALAAHVAEVYGRPVPIVLGIMADKSIDEIIGALRAVASHLVLTAAASPRAAAPGLLLARAGAVCPDVPATAAEGSLDALGQAALLGTPVVVAGSLYLAGEVIETLDADLSS